MQIINTDLRMLRGFSLDASDEYGLKLNANGSMVGGCLSGNARGEGSLDFQLNRSSASQVAGGLNSLAVGSENTASGNYGTAVGFGCTASANYSSAVGSGNLATAECASAFGNDNEATNTYASAFGCHCTAPGNGASAFGCYSLASGYGSSAGGFRSTAGERASSFGYTSEAGGYSSSAIGFFAKASADGATAVGRNVMVDVDECSEFGNISSGNSAGRLRMYCSGMASLTLAQSASAPGDGGSSAGAEADGTLMREAYSIRRNGDAVYLDINIGGTIKTLPLGSAV